MSNDVTWLQLVECFRIWFFIANQYHRHFNWLAQKQKLTVSGVNCLLVYEYIRKRQYKLLIPTWIWTVCNRGPGKISLENSFHKWADLWLWRVTKERKKWNVVRTVRKEGGRGVLLRRILLQEAIWWQYSNKSVHCLTTIILWVTNYSLILARNFSVYL